MTFSDHLSSDVCLSVCVSENFSDFRRLLRNHLANSTKLGTKHPCYILGGWKIKVSNAVKSEWRNLTITGKIIDFINSYIHKSNFEACCVYLHDLLGLLLIFYGIMCIEG